MWPHLSDTDFRSPLFQFTLPSFVGGGGTFGYYWISTAFWGELLLFLGLEMACAAMTGWIVYHTMVQHPRSKQPWNPHFSAQLFGFGVLLPFWFYLPSVLFQSLHVRNLLFKFVLGNVVPTVAIFRTSEAMFGCVPPHATQSSRDYVVYFASLMTFSRCKSGYVPVSTVQMGHRLGRFLLWLVGTGLFHSFLVLHEHLVVFGPAPVTIQDWYSWNRLATWELYANGMVHALLFQFLLSTYMEGLELLWIVVSGYQVDQVMKNPFIQTKSPSDFWSRRWNLLFQRVLKGGVYLPVRKYYSMTTAVVATFVASGLMHEWLLYNMFASQDCPEGDTTCYTPTYGMATIFFLWQALFVAMEHSLGRMAWVSAATRNIPQFLRPQLVIACGLPVVHLFSEAYMRSPTFLHAQPTLPMILRIQGD